MRSDLGDKDLSISHSKSLELIARQLGFKDWNTLHAAIGNRSTASPVHIGETVTGRYLGQSFTDNVLGVQAIAGASRFRLSLNLFEPIDVVTFDSFSSFRKRITCTIDRQGVSAERTSNGDSQMVLELSQ